MVILVGLGQIRFLDDYFRLGQELEMHINVVNDKPYDVDDVRVKVDILGLTQLTSHNFDVDDNSNYGFFFHWIIPYNSKKGEYLVRITASNDDFKDIKYRYITIV